jgi:hypothetical protein
VTSPVSLLTQLVQRPPMQFVPYSGPLCLHKKAPIRYAPQRWTTYNVSSRSEGSTTMDAPRDFSDYPLLDVTGLSLTALVLLNSSAIDGALAHILPTPRAAARCDDDDMSGRLWQRHAG